jgi:N-acetylglucosaminyl-diphospho-decaprenol L-rhamnosyltransferase
MIEFDIVIVNWNSGVQLKECLQSITQASSMADLCLGKCIVVDNASQVGSAEKLDIPFPALTQVWNQENKGFAYGCNQGAKMGTSEYVLFLNPDVKLLPDSLGKALRFLEEKEHSRVGIAGIQLVGIDGIIQRNVARFPTPGSLFHQMLGLDRLWPRHFPSHFMTEWDHCASREVDQVTGAFFMVRRNLFEQLNGFDERFFMYFEDLDFACQAKQAGWTSYYMAEVHAIHHGGGASYQVKARRLSYVLKSRVLYVAKHFGTSSALAILLASLLVESWVRLAWSLVNRSGQNFIETIHAYWIFLETLPHLVLNLKGK